MPPTHRSARCRASAMPSPRCCDVNAPGNRCLRCRSRSSMRSTSSSAASPTRGLVAVYRQFGALSGRDPRDTADEIASVADALVAAIGESPALIDTLGSWAVEAAAAAGPNPDVLAEILPDPAQHAAARKVIRRLATGTRR